MTVISTDQRRSERYGAPPLRFQAPPDRRLKISENFQLARIKSGSGVRGKGGAHFLLCCILPGQLRKAVMFGINNLPAVADDRWSTEPEESADRGAYREKRREARWVNEPAFHQETPLRGIPRKKLHRAE